VAHELTHTEASEFLGVYALDALDADERDAVERHLVGCGFCRAEVLDHVETAGLLSSGIVSAPRSVWERISADLEGTPPPLDMAPIHALRPVPALPTEVAAAPAAPASADPASADPAAGFAGDPPVGEAGAAPARGPFRPAPTNRPGADHRSGDRGSTARGAGLRIGALVAAASIAASVIGVLGLKVVQDGQRIDDLAAGVQGNELERTVNAAMTDPLAVKVELRSTDGEVFADAWMLPDGRGYVGRDNLPPLPSDRDYQLWAVIDGEKISVGLLGNDPDKSAFVASGPVGALAITEEEAGGVVLSLQEPLVVGEITRS
jgi:anti-sigma factor RsiW